MHTIERSREVDRPVDEVWDLWTDVRILPDLSRSTTAVLDAPERLTEVGQTFRQVVQAVGRTVETTWTVTEIVPEDHLTIEGRPVRGVHVTLREQVDAIDDERTCLTLRIDYDLPFGPLGAVAAKLGIERLACNEAASVLAGLGDRLGTAPRR